MWAADLYGFLARERAELSGEEEQEEEAEDGAGEAELIGGGEEDMADRDELEQSINQSYTLIYYLVSKWLGHRLNL